MRLMQSVSAAISMTSLVFALQASSQAAEPVKPMYSDHPASVQSQSSDTSMKKTELKSMKAAGDTMAKAVDAGYWTCTMHPDIHKGEPGNCPKCGMKLVNKKNGKDATAGKSVDHSKMDMKGGKMADTGSWTCPMHPEIHKVAPGNCPRCEMKLMLKKSDKNIAPMTSADQSKIDMNSTKVADDTIVKASNAGFWTCTMHPEVHKPTSGQCPICSMNLVFKKDGKIPKK